MKKTLEKDKKVVRKSAKEKILCDAVAGKLVSKADELVTTTYTLSERRSVRWLKASKVEELTGIKPYTVQDFINGKSMSKSTVVKLARIIEILKQL